MKRFNMVDEEFICDYCHQQISKLKVSARDHCPFCLYSKHVDNLPGDRKNTCLGLLKPIGIEKFNDTYKIVYRCEKCKKIHKNIMAIDDNMDLIIELSKETY
ncbi:MAG: RNHCP domain-containing protein [Bacilli bacterium]